MSGQAGRGLRKLACVAGGILVTGVLSWRAATPRGVFARGEKKPPPKNYSTRPLIPPARLGWENSRPFAAPPLVSSRNDVWETSAEIPYWWRVTTQMWVVLLIGWSKFPTRYDQSEALHSFRQWRVVIIEFLRSFRWNQWLLREISAVFSS